jgi:hypothetical protein
MAKFRLRLQAIDLRKNGESVRVISKKLNVSKSTASLWTRHIILSVQQEENLKKRVLIGGELGRVKGSLVQKEARLQRIKKCDEEAIKNLKTLSIRELDILGTGLYWAEGSKLNRQVKLCNSDPKMIKLFLKWLKEVYQISVSELYCQVGINEAHRNRESVVKTYWSKLTQIPLERFNKTSFKKYPLKKVYENFDDHYGTLSVNVKQPTRIFYQILGKIHAISNLAT